MPGLQQATKTDRSLFSILHKGSVDDKCIFNHIVFKAKLTFCLFGFFSMQVHRHTAQTAEASKHYQKANYKFQKQAVSGEEGTSQGGQNKWGPSCRTLNENEQWLIQVGDGQREGKNQIEIVCQPPNLTKQQLKLQQRANYEIKNYSCYIGTSSFLQHLGGVCSSGLAQSVHICNLNELFLEDQQNCCLQSKHQLGSKI